MRVPVRIAHSESVNVEFERPISVEEAKAALAKAPGVVLMDEYEGRVPAADPRGRARTTRSSAACAGPGHPNALNLWVVADNLRKGAATNAVQVAEELIRRGIVASGSRAGDQ